MEESGKPFMPPPPMGLRQADTEKPSGAKMPPPPPRRQEQVEDKDVQPIEENVSEQNSPTLEKNDFLPVDKKEGNEHEEKVGLEEKKTRGIERVEVQREKKIKQEEQKEKKKINSAVYYWLGFCGSVAGFLLFFILALI